MEKVLEELKVVKTLRSRVRDKCTRRCNAAHDNVEVWSQDEITSAIEELNQVRNELQTSDVKVLKLLIKSQSEDNVVDADSNRCAEYEDEIANAVRLLQVAFAQRAAESAAAAASANVAAAVAAAASAAEQPPQVNTRGTPSGFLKFPAIPLPEYFHEKGDSFEDFIVNFESVFERHPTDDFQKFIFLEKQVKGEAAALLKGLRGKNRIYTVAKELLVKALASSTIQKFDILQKLSNLKLSYNGNCFEFISEMTIIIHTIESLKICMDDVIQYFVWQSMPFLLQTQLINITNNNNPPIDEIQEHIFSAVERFQSLKKRNKDQNSFYARDTAKSEPFSSKTKTATNFAVNLDVKSKLFKPCSLCAASKGSPTDHPIKNVVNFPMLKLS